MIDSRIRWSRVTLTCRVDPASVEKTDEDAEALWNIFRELNNPILRFFPIITECGCEELGMCCKWTFVDEEGC